MNEYQNLKDYEVVALYEQAIKSRRDMPRIMPANDKQYLIKRVKDIRQELVRRGLIL